eukprot:140727-Rhodomonas_salina.1
MVLPEARQELVEPSVSPCQHSLSRIQRSLSGIQGSPSSTPAFISTLAARTRSLRDPWREQARRQRDADASGVLLPDQRGGAPPFMDARVLFMEKRVAFMAAALGFVDEMMPFMGAADA